ncbi:MAG: vWA domain-containing protein [Thermoplasmatota archaeon]
MVKMKVSEGKEPCFVISNEMKNELSLSSEDILIVKNPINQRSTAKKCKFEDGLKNNIIKADRISLESIGLDTDFDVEVYRFDEKLKNIDEVKFGVETYNRSEKDPLTVIKKNEKNFINFIQNEIFTRNSKFYWEEKNLLISIKKTKPKLNVSDVGIFKDSFQFKYEWDGSELKSFDGVLLLDMSGSMEIMDLNMNDIEWVIERMESSLDGPYCQNFLSSIKEERRISRSQGAVLCALLYLVQKIGRGVGDRISMIPFSDESSIITFDENEFFSSSIGDTSFAAERIVKNIYHRTRGHTNLSDGFEKAIEVMKNFDNNKMKMIVVLTDGRPNPEKLDNEEKLLKIIKNRLAPRKDIIINSIGLGTEIDHQLLDKISVMTRGEYTHVNSLEGLTQAYSRYATLISVKGSTF